MSGPWCIERRHELPLRVLLGGDDDALAAAHDWLKQVDLDRLPADTAALLPGIYRRLQSLGVEHAEMERLRGIYRYHWYRNRTLLRAVRQVLDACGERAVHVAPLGWLARAVRDAAEWGTRAIDGADVFVAGSQVEATTEIIAGLGWRADGPSFAASRMRTRSSVCFRSPDGYLLAIHWRLFDWGLAPRDARPEGDREAELLWTCALDPRRQALPPAWLADAAEVLRDRPMDWSLFERRAAAAGVARNAGRALALLAGFGQPIPVQAITALATCGSDADRRIAWLHRSGGGLGRYAYRATRAALRVLGSPAMPRSSR